jgi:hypothetical protein
MTCGQIVFVLKKISKIWSRPHLILHPTTTFVKKVKLVSRHSIIYTFNFRFFSPLHYILAACKIKNFISSVPVLVRYETAYFFFLLGTTSNSLFLLTQLFLSCLPPFNTGLLKVAFRLFTDTQIIIKFRYYAELWPLASGHMSVVMQSTRIQRCRRHLCVASIVCL